MAVDISATGALWSSFTAKAELLGAAVMLTPSEESAAGLLNEATQRFACTRNVAERYPRLAQASATTTDSDEHPQDEHPQEVVALGEFAVAETGSVAVNEPRPDRGM